MTVQVAERSAPVIQVLQGIPVERAVIDPATFYPATRRRRFLQKSASFAGLGLTDQFSLFQDGIIGSIHVRVSGTVTLTPGTATAATTRRWPYDLVKRFRFSANGQANLINASGLKIKALEHMYPDRSDRGVVQAIGGASPGTSRQQGTLSGSNEVWGFGSGVTGLSGAQPFELNYVLPVAMDLELLTGAIFAQTQSTDLVLAIDWANSADLFTLTGTATAAVTAAIEATGKIYSIPIVEGRQVLPDLTQFHSVIEGRKTDVAVGDNEVPLPGIGVGRALQRAYYQLWNGATEAPLAMNATNFGPQEWKYGGADIPERYPTGATLAHENEETFDNDFSTQWGFGIHDFSAKFALRDAVDEGATPNLRLNVNVASGVTVVNPKLEYVQETMFLAPVSA